MAPQLPDSIRVIERGWLSSNNILLFDDATTATLIDSGYVGHAAQTLELIKSAVAGRRLKRLINTHSHSDHIGGNATLQNAWGCEILIPAGIEAHVERWDEEALLLGPARQRGDRFRHDGVVTPGDTLTLGGLAWQALAAPGHDMEALVFHCPTERILVSGDALWADGFGIVFGEILGEAGALAATRQTLEMIARLPVAVVIPGHGAPFMDVEAALDRAFRRLAAFEQDPARMAKNAIKACFVFNLLDLGRLPRSALAAYVDSVPLFRDAGTRLLGKDVDALSAWLLDELLRGGAVRIEGADIVPTLAA
ncbi:MAG: MBL fold metallo-hydrolase [Gammaproteobacteria bacterium]|nr:MBL fold metallo-hydrolase [Gammaproteobacteria bacterium]MBU1647579.1 MBL fold metallo-hydrolase [Gammaproteobacteria bacterium]MBU1971468.1 MBL fold metallo-hydrolase [Gammaproteobacteria bacterium]